MDKILVSIHCLTYNHEKYISEAIESFLMQKTNFKFEILIHDDASTDKTPEIIKEYQKKYPELIKPIFQKENQYSKGVSVSRPNIERAKGKYFAICEGDDFWTDKDKLQKQVDYMETHPECSLCVHAGYTVLTGGKMRPYHRPNNGNGIFSVPEIIKGGGGLFLTNSMLCKTEFVQMRPSFLESPPVGDYPLVINLSLLGTVYYMDELMSAYRVRTEGSWTVKNHSSIEKKIKLFGGIANMLDEIDIYTKFKYKNDIKYTKKYNEFFLLLAQNKFEEAKREEYKEIYLELSYKRKTIIFIKQFFPHIFQFLNQAKRKMIG